MFYPFSHWLNLLSENKLKSFDEFTRLFPGTVEEKKELIKLWLGYENMEEVIIGGAKFTKLFLSKQEKFKNLNKEHTQEYIIFDGSKLSSKINAKSLALISSAESLTEILLTLPTECQLDLLNQIPDANLMDLYRDVSSLINTLKSLDDAFYLCKARYRHLSEDKRTSEFLAQKLGFEHLQKIIRTSDDADQIIRLVDKESRSQTNHNEKNQAQELFHKKNNALLHLNNNDLTALAKFLMDQSDFNETKEIISAWLGYEGLNDQIDISFTINQNGERILFNAQKTFSTRKDDTFKLKFNSFDILQTVLFVLPIEARLDFLNRFDTNELYRLIHHVDHLRYLLNFFQEDQRQNLLLLDKLDYTLPLIVLTASDLDNVLLVLNSPWLQKKFLSHFAKVIPDINLSRYQKSKFYNELHLYVEKETLAARKKITHINTLLLKQPKR